MKKRSSRRAAPRHRRERILVWGLGRVGSVSAACLADRGYRVFALDVDPRRVEAFRAGGFADEPGLSHRIHRNLDIGRLRVFVTGKDAIPQADFSWICVGTSGGRGHPDLRSIERAVRDIGALVARSRSRHTVLVRSTVPPGTTRGRLWPLLQKAAGRASTRCGMVACPEFLREGAAVRDFVSASYHVIGAWDSKASAAAA